METKEERRKRQDRAWNKSVKEMKKSVSEALIRSANRDAHKLDYNYLPVVIEEVKYLQD